MSGRTELNMKEMAVNTGIGLKYDEATGALASPMGMTGAGAVGGSDIVRASATAAASIVAGASSSDDTALLTW